MTDLLYDLTDIEGIRSCYDENGVVAIRGILSPEDIKNTLNDVESIIKKSDGENFSLSDPYM